MTIGRRKFIKPLYEELAKTPEGKARAMDIYGRARPSYHPIAVTSIDEVLKWTPITVTLTSRLAAAQCGKAWRFRRR